MERTLKDDIRVRQSLANAADGSLGIILPAGFALSKIVVKEKIGNAVTGGINIGTAESGAQVVAAEAVGASALVDCTLVAGVFSLSADTTLYISAASDWNSASVDVYVTMMRLTEDQV